MVYNIKLVVDNRENIKDKLKDKIEKVEYANLEIGDYAYYMDDEPILIIERKTISDYAASIVDKRKKEQIHRLKSNVSKDRLLYLVEGDLTKNNCNFQFNKISKDTIISSIINTMFREEIYVFHTANTDETIEVLEMIFKKYQKQGLTFMENKTNHKDDLVETAKSCKKANMTTEIGFKMMLNAIPNVSNKLATRINEKFENMKELVNWLSQYEDNNTRIKELVNIGMDNTDKPRKINKNAATNIVNYLGFNC
jgi:ERCC4-type nuclease